MASAYDAPPSECARLLMLAERDPRRAVQLARIAVTLPIVQPAQYVWAHYTLGWALLFWERFDDARSHLSMAAAACAAEADSCAGLRCQQALLLVELMQRAPPDLEQKFLALAECFAQIGAHADEARTWLYLAAFFNTLGRPRDAEVLCDRVMPLFVSSDGGDRARLLRVRGVAAILLSEYDRATDMLEQAEQMFALLHSPIERAKCWNQQAWIALRQEKLDLALERYRRAAHVFTRLDMPLQHAFGAKNIGFICTRLGMYDLALPATLEALVEFERLQRAGDIAECHMHLGNIYFYTGRWEAAFGYYARADIIFVAAQMIGYSLIVRRNLAIIYRLLGQRDEAAEVLAAIETQARDLGNRGELAEIWGEQAELLADEGQIDAALERHQQARELFVQIGNLLGAAHCAMEQGRLTLARGAIHEAEQHFQFAAPLVIRHPYDQWRTSYGLGRCAELCGASADALFHYRAALATVAGLRRRLASEEVSSSLYKQAEHLHVDAVRLAAAQGAVAEVIEIAEGQRALVLQRLIATGASVVPEGYQQEHEALRAQISSLLPAVRRQRAEQVGELDGVLAAYSELLLRSRHSSRAEFDAVIQPIEPSFDHEQTRAALCSAYGGEWTALVYVWLDQAVLLVGVLTPERVEVVSLRYDSALKRLIERASQPAYRFITYHDILYHEGRAARRWDILRTLAERLLPPEVRARLHADHRLVIVPAGPLHALPWAALRLDDTVWLVERAIVQIVPSLAAWQLLTKRPSSRGQGALLVGCSTFGERAAGLPGVLDELRLVESRWSGDCEQLVDDQATRPALLTRLSSGAAQVYSLLHIASHAQLVQSRGLAACVRLFDSDLLLPEIVSLRLEGALVVLSACQGAASDALPGEEVLSLSWAFLAAGASGVLASLWSVPDGAAVPFMAALYDALHCHGDGAVALAMAQRRLIAEVASDEVVSQPQCWGSFVLTGLGYRF